MSCTSEPCDASPSGCCLFQGLADTAQLSTLACMMSSHPTFAPETSTSDRAPRGKPRTSPCVLIVRLVHQLTCCCPRTKLHNDTHTMSDSKPLLSPSTPRPHPHTPKNTTQKQGKYPLAPSRISFPSASSSALYSEDPDAYDSRTSAYRTDGASRARGDVETGMGERTRPGLPKLSRECLWS